MADAERLARLLQVAPPPELERSVRQRLLASVEANAEPASVRARTRQTDDVPTQAAALGTPATAVPLAECGVYVAGVLGFGARVVSVAAQLVWRAVLG
jgi:hypothetical protein